MTNFYGEIVLNEKQTITKKLWIKYAAFGLIAVVLAVIDQVTKFWFVGKVGGEVFKSIEIIKGVLNFTYIQNKGASMGILQGQRVFLIILTFIILGVGAWYFKKYRPENNLFLTSCTLILSGAIGNLIDRAMYGYVRDFIDVQFIDFYIFNVADCGIVIGAVLLVIYAFVSMDDNKEKH